MNNQHLQGMTVNGGSLMRVINTLSFQSYAKSCRPNNDKKHAKIIESCTATKETYQDLIDNLFGVEKQSDFLSSGGSLLVPTPR